MYAQLGGIVFEKCTGFLDYSKTGTMGYAEHKPLVGKPRLQPLGSSLNELAVSIRLHVKFTKPERDLATLKRYMNENEILKLTNGLEVEEGHYVITDINETLEDADINGRPFSYLVNLTLKEYVIPDKVQAKKDEDKDKAVATGNKKPTSGKKKNNPTCPKEISALVSAIDARSKDIAAMVAKSDYYTAPSQNKIRNNAETIIKDCNNLINRVSIFGNCIFNNISIRDKAMGVSSSANTLKNNILFASFLLYSNSMNLTSNVSALKTAAHPIIKQAASGK